MTTLLLITLLTDTMDQQAYKQTLRLNVCPDKSTLPRQQFPSVIFITNSSNSVPCTRLDRKTWFY